MTLGTFAAIIAALLAVAYSVMVIEKVNHGYATKVPGGIEIIP